MSDILKEISNGHKYTLVMAGEQDDGFFYVPLPLDGSETTDCAISRFRDALTVLRHKAAEKYHRGAIGTHRIDGKPSDDDKFQIPMAP